jgi:uncharacterized protein YxjI
MAALHESPKEVARMRYVIREKAFHLGEDSDITDESGRKVLQVEGKIFTLHNTLVMRDLMGNEVATIRKQLTAIRPSYEITRYGHELATVRKKLLTFLGDRFTIDIPGPDDYEVKGDLFGHEYTMSRGGQVVATISKHWVSLTDTYGVETAPGQDDVLILASALVLDQVEDQEHGQH